MSGFSFSSTAEYFASPSSKVRYALPGMFFGGRVNEKLGSLVTKTGVCIPSVYLYVRT